MYDLESGGQSYPEAEDRAKKQGRRDRADKDTEDQRPENNIEDGTALRCRSGKRISFWRVCPNRKVVYNVIHGHLKHPVI